MSNTLFRILEVIALRALPGLVNLTTLFLVSGRLTTSDYGIYSTIIATTGFVANIMFGPLTFAIVSQYAQLDAKGLANAYKSSLVSSVLLIALAISAFGLLAWWAGFIHWAWIAPAVSFGIFTAVQEIPHARLKLWSYGAASLTQSIVFLSLIWLFAQPLSEPSIALTAFSISYGVGTITSLFLSGLPTLRLPNMHLLSRTLGVGGHYTLSTGIEHGLHLGMRYVILLLGTPQHLGIFSFCVDVAHRLIGFFVNAASFAIVPMAFKTEADGDGGRFKKTLIDGAILAIGLALISFTAVLLLWQSGWIPTFTSDLFDPTMFAIVSGAVVLNRVKKIVIDPLAMRARKAITIAVGYAISTPIALMVGAVSLGLGIPRGVELSYLAGYVFAAIITIVAFKRSVDKGHRL